VTETQAFLDKAEESFKAAELLLGAGSPGFASSRAYYGCFYIAHALLLTRGHRFSSHGQVIGQYGLLFARPHLLDRRFHQLLIRASELRKFGDYQVEVPIDSEVVADLIRDGRDFLLAASRYLRDLEEDSGSSERGQP
jgi:uncharacterized protein (UPF0332 family)